MRVLVVVSVLVAAAPRYAEAEYACPSSDCCCTDITHHPGKPITCNPSNEEYRSVCYDESSGGGGGQVNPSIVKGAGAVAFVIILPFAPAHVISLFGPIGSKEESDRAFKTYLAAQRDLRKLGRQAGWIAKAMRDAEAGVVDEAAQAKERARRLGFDPPKLVPSMDWLCDQAMMLLPFRTEWPVGAFPSQGDLRLKCGPVDAFTVNKPPVGDPPVCDADLLTCAGALACCPRSHPVYNPCDNACYRTSDFRAAEGEAGLRCNRHVRCGVTPP